MVEYKIKSLNCDSCAAPLIKKVNSNMCKCTYCGNTNIILSNGKVVIHNIETPLPKRANNKDEPINKYMMLLVILFGVFGAFICYYIYRNKKNRKIITLDKKNEPTPTIVP